MKRAATAADALTRGINRKERGSNDRARDFPKVQDVQERENGRLLLLMFSLIDKNNLDHLLNEQSAIMNSRAGR